MVFSFGCFSISRNVFSLFKNFLLLLSIVFVAQDFVSLFNKPEDPVFTTEYSLPCVIILQMFRNLLSAFVYAADEVI